MCGYRAANATGNLQPCIVWLARAEKNFELGIILLEEARQVRFQIRFSTRQRLQQREWRSKARPLSEAQLSAALPLTKISRHRRQSHAGKDRRSNEAEYGDR